MSEENKNAQPAQDTNWDDISFLDDMELGEIDPESYQEQEDDAVASHFSHFLLHLLICANVEFL